MKDKHSPKLPTHTQINAFMYEDDSMLTVEDWLHIFHQQEKSIETFVQKIHIDTEVNRNVYFPDDERRYCRVVVKGEQLEYQEKTYVLEHMLRYHVVTIEVKLDEMQNHPEIQSSVYGDLKIFLSHLTRKPDQKERVKTKMELVLLNGQRVVKKQLEHML
jgi:uncharacterized surface protein with fasciclin (FAS1) repeats